MQVPMQQAPPAMPANTRVQFQGSFVTQFEEVRQFPCPLNGQIILIDNLNRRLYIKGLDSTGNPVIETYMINDVDSQIKSSQQVVQNNVTDRTNNDVIKVNDDIEKRIKDLEQKVESFNKIVEGLKI